MATAVVGGAFPQPSIGEHQATAIHAVASLVQPDWRGNLRRPARRLLPGSADVYDPATGIWSSLATLPTARTDFSAAAVNGLLSIIDGLDQSLAISGANEAYTP